jgi:hypothetical protein
MDNLPYKADVLPDQFFYDAFDRIEEVIDSLIEASKKDQRKHWIESQFSSQYPKDLTDTQMIGDIFSSRFSDINRDIYQCENCGRILIQRGNSNLFVFFKPEDDDWKNILSAGE